ncbi:NADP-dependent malic enzyme isoform X2 [Cinnamomum micranthum f. kanehirae]|uniref:NADP-dependent malic enzyme isoform X2 n=1 Tax=Cinnamomum micranthum f. kanehirae TaxID=337451 RepID=A0A443Q4N3_9MAGN|nr:NADP-dependent malic enzyme isoform X2 [Cinnamomum micranthum f. kanehirae]
MMSLSRSSFLNNSNITNNVYHNEIRSSGVSSSSCCYSFCHSRRKAVILCCHSRGGERKVRALMESTLKETREGASVIDVDSKSTVGGGVEEAYVEDRATEDHFVTPWTVSVASGYSLLRDPQHNKGLAFTEKERDAHFLRGLLPPAWVGQELQVRKDHAQSPPIPSSTAKIHGNDGSSGDDSSKTIILYFLSVVSSVIVEMNEKLFYSFSLIMSKNCFLLSIHQLLVRLVRNMEHFQASPGNIQVIVVTDGERILGLGDLGCQGMGIPVGKLALYTALGGVRPSACLPITIDVGTNNEKLLKDEFYIGLRQKRATGQEYADLLHEFMCAVKQSYGEKVLVQFEDFANHNAFELLAKYRNTHLVFNDDIQGTASVVLAGLAAALNLVGGTLAEHTFLFLGAGEAGTGIAELIALEMSKQFHSKSARKKIWLVDSKGLIVRSRKESLQHFKKPWAHENEPVTELLDAVKAIKPTVLIGTSGVGKTFTKEVVEAMASFNEKPIILALSNPTSQSECTAEEAYTWSKGRAIFASGSPFDPVEYNGKVFVPGQSNNAYIFPGFGLGLVISGAVRVHDDMLLAASEALAAQVTQEDLDKGQIYPPFSNIRKISAHIAANVAAKAYDLGLATRLPRPADLVKYAENCMYNPVYRSYR